jgi:uncharacterized membrane protein
LAGNRIPALGLLWPGLVLAYLVSTTLGLVPATLAILGLMAGATVASSGHLLAGLAAGIALAAAAWRYADVAAYLVYVPPLAALGFMAALFGRTLRAGSEPLIARIARKEHPDLPPDVARYAHLVTALWAACFFALFLVALVLAPLVSLEAWSRWTQALGLVTPCALFFGEYIYRHYRFPGRSQGSLSVLVANVIAVFREQARETVRPEAGMREPQ